MMNNMKAVAATMLLLALLVVSSSGGGVVNGRHHGGGGDGGRHGQQHGGGVVGGLTQCVTMCASGVSACMLGCYGPTINVDPVELPVCLLRCTNDAVVCASGCPVV